MAINPTSVRTVELEGNLSVLSLEDALLLIGSKTHTGVLVVESEDTRSSLFFYEGQLVGSESHLNNRRIGETLVQLKVLERLEFESLLTRSPERSIILTLLDYDKISTDQWNQCAQVRLEDDAVHLFSLTEGDFRFEVGPISYPELLRIPMPIEDFIRLGRQLAQDWDEIRRTVPLSGCCPRVKSFDGMELASLSLSMEQWSVLSHINGKNSVDFIVNQSGIGRLGSLRALVFLCKSNLIEFPPPSPRTVESESHVSSSSPESPENARKPVELVCLFINRFCESLKGKLRDSYPSSLVDSAWQEIKCQYPLAELLNVDNGIISINGFHRYVDIYQAIPGTDSVEKESELALCCLSDRIYQQAEELCGKRWASGLYNKIHKAVFESSRIRIPAEDVGRLPLKKRE